MGDDADRHVGIAGWAERIPLPPVGSRASVDHDATLDAWLVFHRTAHPWWTFYMVGAIHLRDIPGGRPPHRDKPDSSHEILVVALHPDDIPAGFTAKDYNAVNPAFLTPVNVVMQFSGTTDAEIVELAGLAARGCARGYLNPEPEGCPGARDAWRMSMYRTLEHIRHGGHPNG